MFESSLKKWVIIKIWNLTVLWCSLERGNQHHILCKLSNRVLIMRRPVTTTNSYLNKYKYINILSDLSHLLFALSLPSSFALAWCSCCCWGVMPSTTLQTLRQCAWWRRSCATWATTSSRSRSWRWRPPCWWSHTRYILAFFLIFNKIKRINLTLDLNLA